MASVPSSDLCIGSEFASFDDLNAAIKQYSDTNNIVYVIGDCRSVATANKRVHSKKIIPFDTKFKYSYCKSIGAGFQKKKKIPMGCHD